MLQRLFIFAYLGVLILIAAGAIIWKDFGLSPTTDDFAAEQRLRNVAEVFKRDDYDAALKILEDLDPETLSPRNTAIYLGLRSYGRLMRAREYPSDDAELVEILDDLLEVQSSMLDNPAPTRGLADVLERLGAYPEAEAMYELAMEQTLDRPWRIAIDRAAGYRNRGEYERALIAFDAIFAEFSNETRCGMQASYHRGRLYFDMGRYEEADASFLVGLHSQADYPWVYMYMGCAGAHLGKVDQALEDYAKGAELFEKAPGSSPARKHNAAVIQSELAAIQEMARAGGGPAAKAGHLCKRFWPDGVKRQRSPLLPADIARRLPR